jgi:hypothetical protein
MFCAPELICCGSEGVGSHYHVLRARTLFLRYRGSWVPFLCFAHLDSFFAVSGVTCPVFDGTEEFGSRFHVLLSQTHFRRHWEWRFPFQVLVSRTHFGGTGCDVSRFHVLRSRTHFRRGRALTRFRRYRGRRLPFSCIALSDLFPMVPKASGPVFMFLAPVLIFDGTEGLRSRFHVLRTRTHFRR